MIVDYFGEKYYEYHIIFDDERDLIVDVTQGGFQLSYTEFLILQYIIKFRRIYIKIDGSFFPANMREGVFTVANV